MNEAPKMIGWLKKSAEITKEIDLEKSFRSKI